ncbi:MAG TPA: DUF6666 family protein [Pirellulales bacterium]|nr:DUF6666 family protein [Pirellulales bacterium]
MSRHVLRQIGLALLATLSLFPGSGVLAQGPANMADTAAYGQASAAIRPFDQSQDAYRNGALAGGSSSPSAGLTLPRGIVPATGAPPAYPTNNDARFDPDANVTQLSYTAQTASQSDGAVPQQNFVCTQCEDASCDACRGACVDAPGCQDCPRFGFEAFQGFDSFRGPPEGIGPSNFGEVTGANAAMPVYEPWGIGWQLGASYGIYDFSGRPPPATQLAGAQQQIFVTTGFFRRARNGQRMSFGLVHDWMINNNYSQFALSPTLGQWRGQLEWAMSDRNSLGLWATVRDKSYFGARPDNTNQFQAISQINAFWHHKYAFGGDTWLRIGMPLSKTFVGNRLAGSAIIGATAQLPLNEQLALYANAMYMAPNTAAGPIGASRDTYNISMGFAWYPGRNARTPNVNGGCWLPYMPLGNNGNFLVDSVHFD